MKELTRNDIVFEDDILADSHIHSQDDVEDALLKLVNRFLEEKNVEGLNSILVKATNFFDNELGLANYKKNTIVLANKTAYCLVDETHISYRKSLAVLYHELYHFRDYQNLVNNIRVNHVSCFDDTLQNGYTYWTEFYASYSTFDIFEDEGLYASFEAIFERKDASEGKKKYFTARVFGYYLHENHLARCDNLINRYLSKDDIEKATESFKSVMNSYPVYTDYQLRNIGIEMSKVINKPKEKMILTPMPAGRLWQRKR